MKLPLDGSYPKTIAQWRGVAITYTNSEKLCLTAGLMKELLDADQDYLL